MKIKILLLIWVCSACSVSAQSAQDGFDRQWIFGRFTTPVPSGTVLDFNGDTLNLTAVDKKMELEGSCAIMCDAMGKLLFYSNGCYIANASHQVMANGDSIGKGLFETSYCNTGGNPINQGIIALPKPQSDHLYYLFYTDLGEPYEMTPYFPLAPITLYYSIIDMSLENGMGKVVEKNKIILQDTFSKGMIQAAQHANGKDWWIILPKSHTNCYWTIHLTSNGIENIFKQCNGPIWMDNDSQGQAVFSPNKKYYARFNYFYGLNLFNFNDSSGKISILNNVDFGKDTFNFNGLSFSPNSRFVYAACNTKLWQFDTQNSDFSLSRILIGTLITPFNISTKTRFNHACLAPNGKIYIGGSNAFNYLHSIDYPNCYGPACGLNQYSVKLFGTSTYTMPNFPHYKKWIENDTCKNITSISPVDEHLSSIRFYPNPVQNYLFAFGIKEGDNLDFLDPLGNLVFTVTWNDEQLNIETLAIGFYIIKVKRNHVLLGNFTLIKI